MRKIILIINKIYDRFSAQQDERSPKFIVNISLLYLRIFIVAAISLLTTRVALKALEITDYGIFNLIAGAISLLSFFTIALEITIQRYLSFYKGKKEVLMLSNVFRNSLFLIIIIAPLIAVILEICGVFLFNHFFTIPAPKLEIARNLYHLMVVSAFFSILSVPFISLLLAYENMFIIVSVSIADTLMKVAIAFIILYIDKNKLLTYGILTCVSTFICLILYAWYCYSKYDECRIRRSGKAEWQLFKELTHYAGWNSLGAICSLGRIQGLAILLNMFFGPVTNASYAISLQVAAQLGSFSAVITRAYSSQIMQSEGRGDRNTMLGLSMLSGKISFYMFAIVAIPCIFEMPSLLNKWLANVPENTPMFCTFILIGGLANQLTIGLQSALQATGKVKIYQSLVGLVLLFNLPIAYLLLKSALPVYYVFFSYVFIELSACLIRLLLANRIAALPLKVYLSNIVLKESVTVIITSLACFTVIYFFKFEWRFLLTGMVSVIVFIVCVFRFGTTLKEKELLRQFLFNVRTKKLYR